MVVTPWTREDTVRHTIIGVTANATISCSGFVAMVVTPWTAEDTVRHTIIGVTANATEIISASFIKIGKIRCRPNTLLKQHLKCRHLHVPSWGLAFPGNRT